MLLDGTFPSMKLVLGFSFYVEGSSFSKYPIILVQYFIIIAEKDKYMKVYQSEIILP